MATFLEIKELLKYILCIETDVDEHCDIIIPNVIEEKSPFVILNKDLEDALNNLQSYNTEKLELSNNIYREVAIRFSGPPPRLLPNNECIVDTTNDISYTVDIPSIEYCLFLLSSFADSINNGDKIIRMDLRHRTRIALRRLSDVDNYELRNFLSDILRIYTLKVETKNSRSIKLLRSYSCAFEFSFMYKQGIAIQEYTDVQDICSIGSSRLRRNREELDSPPQRIINSDVLDYYTMALESRDPFTMYISYYHVVEHYFDAVFRKKLTEQIKEKITSPDFSYKSETKIYELAKFIKKHMNSDGESGKGDEFESLRYVLMEYVPIEELLSRLESLDIKAKEYYQNEYVPFTTSKKTKIAWSNPEGTYTNIAKRIYETRNSLVHSKSEQIENQYKPYENAKDLLFEIPLIEAIAELVIINSSEIM